MSKKDGGPAFPRIWDDHTMTVNSPGMSLRDWFAGMALQGFLACPGAGEGTPTERARMCLAEADAMLAERAK